MLTSPDSQLMLCTPGNTLGNRFSLINLIRKRARHLVDGSPPLIETESRNPVSVAMEEVYHAKVRIGIVGKPNPNQTERNDPLMFQSKALAFALGLCEVDGEGITAIEDA